VVNEVILGVMTSSLIRPCIIIFQEVVVEKEELNQISAQQTKRRS
jgi:hypothetical protein